MYYSTITPEEASVLREVSVDEQLHDAVNTLLYSFYSGSPIFIYQEDVIALIHPLWNHAEHGRRLEEILQRYSSSGWSVVEDNSNPHRLRWSFSAASSS